MRAQKVYEALGDIFKPKPKEQIKQEYWNMVHGDMLKPVIFRKAKNGEEVRLFAKEEFFKYQKATAERHDYKINAKVGDYVVLGFLFVEEIDNGQTYWEWKMPKWTLDGKMAIEYSWYKPGMEIDPITEEEFNKLPGGGIMA